MRDHGLHKIAHRIRIGDIEGLGEDFGVMLLADLPGRRLQGGFVAGTHGDLAALGGEGQRSRFPDSLAGSSHDGDPVP